MKVNDRLIEQLFLGNITPSNSFTYKTDNYVSAGKKLENLNELLASTLDEKQTKLLDELIETKSTMTDEMVIGAFKDGFKIGMRLTVEGLSSDYLDED